MYNTTDGKNVYDECLKLTKEYFPQYVIELEAMASGAGILFHHVSLLREVYALQFYWVQITQLALQIVLNMSSVIFNPHGRNSSVGPAAP